jgi:hypothetical protein
MSPVRFAQLAALCALVLAAVPGGDAAIASSPPPPGATARCRDGTYSYSRHRSGTCSHHGGVAQWLTAGGTSGSATGVPALGRTMLLAPRTRNTGCLLGANPDRRCSPGAYYTGLTRAVICSPGFRTSSIRNVPRAEKYAVESEYGMEPGSYGRTLEIDHIVSLELGGSNDIANLFPERADAHPGYAVKDRLENRLHALVCSGQIALRSAQRRIAADWQALYRAVFGVPPSD